VINKLFIGEEGFDETTADDSSADTGTAFGEDDSEFNIFNTNRQLSALQTAVKMLGALNEKKVLVYFASGLNLNGLDNQAQFQSTTNAAVRANVVFYAVDARGLVAAPPMGDASHGSPGGIAMYNGGSTMAGALNFSKSQDSMYSLATDTGGKALLDTNDLGQGIIEAEQSIND
jgi:VWFA-related protein